MYIVEMCVYFILHLIYATKPIPFINPFEMLWLKKIYTKERLRKKTINLWFIYELCKKRVCLSSWFFKFAFDWIQEYMCIVAFQANNDNKYLCNDKNETDFAVERTFGRHLSSSHILNGILIAHRSEHLFRVFFSRSYKNMQPRCNHQDQECTADAFMVGCFFSVSLKQMYCRVYRSSQNMRSCWLSITSSLLMDLNRSKSPTEKDYIRLGSNDTL